MITRSASSSIGPSQEDLHQRARVYSQPLALEAHRTQHRRVNNQLR